MRKSKGISTFIATLLLMVLAVSAGVVIYAYTMGYLGGFGGTEQMGSMSIDSQTATDGTGGSGIITAYVRNTGKTTIEFDIIYVEGVQYTYETGDTDGVPSTGGEFAVSVDGTAQQTLDEGDIAKVVIEDKDIDETSTGGDIFVAGKTYEVKIVAADNTQVSFSVKVE